MKRGEVIAVVAGVSSVLLGSAITVSGILSGVTVDSIDLEATAVKALWAVGIGLLAFGGYRFLFTIAARAGASKRRLHNLRNVLRLGFSAVAFVAILGILTERWIGLAVSLGLVGFAVTVALQQPLFSLVGWFYILTKRPYQVGDRVRIEGSKGDVIEVDFLVTTLWEINGELVSSNQPSGRIITLPNSVVLSSHVHNYSQEEFPYVWNEISIAVAYESDIDYARETMIGIADDYLGDEMASHIANYRALLAETPVELEVRDRPTINLVQEESWVHLRLRYLTHPKRGQIVKNTLYERVIAAFNDSPDRISFPVGRNR